MPVLLGRGVGRAPGGRGLPMVRVVVNPRHVVVAGEVRVLGRPRHVVLGVEVEAGMPDRAGIHVGVLIQKIAYIHLPWPAPGTCCAAVLLAAGWVCPSFTTAHLGALGSCVLGPGTSLPTGFYWAQPLTAFALKGRFAFQSAGTPRTWGANSNLSLRVQGGQVGG